MMMSLVFSRELSNNKIIIMIIIIIIIIIKQRVRIQ